MNTKLRKEAKNDFEKNRKFVSNRNEKKSKSKNE